MATVIPNYIISREELNLRHGIKSSIPDMQKLLASVIALFKISDGKPLSFSEEYSSNSRTKIKLKSSLEEPICSFFEKQLMDSAIPETDLINKFNDSPLLTSQLEALQVALQLYWRIAEISFVENKADSSERTGGHRYNKEITFSINLDIIEEVLTDEQGEYYNAGKNLLFNYLTGSTLDISATEKKLSRVVTVFSEETQYKIRNEESGEVYFQQEGIYKEICDGNNVTSRDSHEPVGPFRILKNAVKNELNYHIEDSTNEFKLKSGHELDDLNSYYKRVSTFLNLTPKKIYLEVIKESEGIDTQPISDEMNVIYYGAPGTGKSYNVNSLLKGKEDTTERVTFHPEYDYASFVGGYKPTMELDEKGKEVIKYKFVPQVFTNIYVEAWKSIKSDEEFYLVIEEINRGNCAEIFGDIFQLLDRNSNYEITPSKELKQYLIESFQGQKLGIEGGKMRLPSNLKIYATMNTSDQSLFPMDSAFKRRWRWIYVPICYEENYENGEQNKSYSFVVKIDDEHRFKWIDFIKSVNKIIKENPNLGADKCIGNYFVIPNNGEIELRDFINKVMFYLWNDVFRDEEESIFVDGNTYEDFFPINTNGKEQLLEIISQLDLEFINNDE